MGTLLSIVIPTYNRADLIGQALDCLKNSIEDYACKIELIISDNCSSDNTEDIIREYKECGFNLTYYRQKENIGFEANFEFLIDKSKGKYIFLMGDDDLLSPDFLSIIMRYISNNDEEYSIIHWNRLSGDEKCDNNTLYDKKYHALDRKLTPSEFIIDRMSSPNFISSLVFSRRCWELGGDIDLSSFYGYKWFGRIYWGAILSGYPCAYYYMPLSIQRVAHHAWIKEWPVYMLIGLSNIFRSLNEHVDGLYEKWIKKNNSDSNIEYCIRSICKDQKFYQQYENEFYEHLNKTQRQTIRFWLHTPFPNFMMFIHRCLRFLHIHLL